MWDENSAQRTFLNTCFLLESCFANDYFALQFELLVLLLLYVLFCCVTIVGNVP